MSWSTILLIEESAEAEAIRTFINHTNADTAFLIYCSSGLYRELEALAIPLPTRIASEAELEEAGSKAGLTICMNPAVWSKNFLSRVQPRLPQSYYIGIFDWSLRRKNAALRCLINNNTGVYVSDYDFKNEDNLVAIEARNAGMPVIVIPFKIGQAPPKSSHDFKRFRQGRNDEWLNVCISGKIQFKRRNYLMALTSISIAAFLGMEIRVVLNGRPAGLYGHLILIYSKILNLIPIKVQIGFYRKFLTTEVYTKNVSNSDINLMPLTKFYSSGRDCGAFYDSLVYGVKPLVPRGYLDGIGSALIDDIPRYSSVFDLVQQLLQERGKNKKSWRPKRYSELDRSMFNEYVEKKFELSNRKDK